MEDKCLVRTPPGGDFNERLQQLAIEAKQQPPLSPQRQLLLNRLVNKIFWTIFQFKHFVVFSTVNCVN
jgi:hypothetical protein